ncbi:MAG: TerC family protein [Saezia sp.]
MLEFPIVLLLTLIVLEIVLGVDNLVFIAILADKLPLKQRDKARVIGLTLALVMRVVLLYFASWLVSLNEPLFTVVSHPFSVHDLVMLAGGLFLIYKATMELHERLEGVPVNTQGSRERATLRNVILQIVALDAVFSLDSVILAVGLAKDHFGVMVAAVTIAMGAMMFASKPLTKFVNAHPTVVVLCLSFLLMIGTSLIGEGFGFDIDKKYIYAAIGFSIMIEVFNQIARHNFMKYQAKIPLRERTTNAIFSLIGLEQSPVIVDEVAKAGSEEEEAVPALKEEERFMIRGILTLTECSIQALMTPRMDISWIDSEDEPAQIRKEVVDSPHNLFPICDDSLDHVLGVASAKDILDALDRGVALKDLAKKYPPVIVPESVDALKLMSLLRGVNRRLVIVSDEFGVIQGVITPMDILEAIAGEFPDEDETLDIVKDGQTWIADGGTTLPQLERTLGSISFITGDEEYATLAGLLLEEYGQIPKAGTVIKIAPYEFEVLKMDRRRIETVRIKRFPKVS